MTRSKILLFLLAILPALCCHEMAAKNVTPARAAQYARSFWGSRAKVSSTSSDLVLAWDSGALSASVKGTTAQDKLFYVFTPSGSNGYIIVSAEDAVMPVLAYSFEDPAPSPDNIPVPMADWIGWVSAQIEGIRESGVQFTAATGQWAEARAGNAVVLLETAKWNQGDPYNRFCPMDGSYRSLAGCVPVAAAIVMRYHRWPESGKGSTNAYRTDSKGLSVAQRNLEHSYDWDNMPLAFVEGNYSEEQALAVSTILADVGAAFQADYAAEGTGASLKSDVMYANFGYNPSMSQIPRENYDDKVWLSMLRGELDAFRPVVYCGYDVDNGHAFILDGYTDDDYFHVNWGWGGEADGYFTLSTLTPYDDPGYSFNSNHFACFGLKPGADDATVEDWMKFRAPGMVVSAGTIEKNSSFLFNELHFINNTAVDFSGSLCGALTDRDGNVKEWITRRLDYELPWGYWVKWPNVSATVTVEIESGDRLRFFYKPDNCEEWFLIKSNGEKGCIWEVPVTGETFIDLTSFSFDRRSRRVTIETVPGVEARLSNSSSEDFTDRITAGDTVIVIDMEGLPEDVYTLELVNGEERKLLNINVKTL